MNDDNNLKTERIATADDHQGRPRRCLYSCADLQCCLVVDAAAMPLRPAGSLSTLLRTLPSLTRAKLWHGFTADAASHFASIPVPHVVFVAENEITLRLNLIFVL